MPRYSTTRNVALVLALVIALAPVLLHYISYSRTGHYTVSKQDISKEVGTRADEVGTAVVCTYGRNLWGGHFVWSKRHHWKSYTKNRCLRPKPASRTQNLQAHIVNLNAPSTADMAMEGFQDNSTAVVVLNACLGEEKGANSLTSIGYVYSYFDRLISCGSELASQNPKAIIAWKLDYSMVSSGSEIEELVDFAINKHVMESCGIIVLNPDHEVEGGVAQRLRQLAAHLMMSTATEVVGRLIAFQRDGLKGYGQNTLHRRCQLLLYTRKYDPFCHPVKALAHPLLITGLGGAGTHYIAQRLAAEGWRLRHEEIGQDGAVSWFYAASDRAIDLPYPYGELPEDHRSGVLYPRFGHVVHLVRDPMAQIASFTAHSNKTYNFVVRAMQDVLPLLLRNGAPRVIQQFQQARAQQDRCVRGEGCHLHYAALAWLHWNRFVHRFADATFRVEQVEEIVEHVCRVVSALEAELSPPVSVGRYCDVPSCPAVGNWTVGWRHSAVRVADRLFGVCRINAALFRRSAVHKRHLQFSLEEVRRLDPQLADDIITDAALYGLAVT